MADTPSHHAESATEADTAADQTDDSTETPLPRSFRIRAGGPVTKTTAVTESITECDETTIQLSRRVTNLDEFARFYDVRTRSNWKRRIIQYLLATEGTDHVDYDVDPSEWRVCIDGRVEAYRGVIEVLADPDLDISATTMTDTAHAAIARELADLHVGLVHTEVKSEDDAFARLARECHREELFGNGATLAHLDAIHGAEDDLVGSVAQFLEDLHDDAAER